MFGGLIKLIIVVSIAGGTIFSFDVYDEYSKAKTDNPDIKLLKVVKESGQKWTEKIKSAASLENTAKGEIQKIKLGQIERALKMYHAEYGKYPFSIDELKNEGYIEKNIDILEDPSFYYSSFISGFKIGLELESGEKYEINN